METMMTQPKRLSLTVLVGLFALPFFTLVLTLVSCGQLSESETRRDSEAAQAVYEGAPLEPVIAAPACDHHDPNRNLFWGELHVHTGISGDAFRSDVRTTPDDAYRFAQGEPIMISPLDSEGNGTQRIQLERPLDFAAVTDHAETFGTLELCGTPGGPAYDSPGCAYYRRLPPTPAFPRAPDIPPRHEVDRMICGEDYSRCEEASANPWQEISAAAARWNDTSSACSFTTFLAYEWSGAYGGPLLHRNVIFRNATAPLPIGSHQAKRPWDLFRYLQSECLDAGTGCDVLSIPHNSNTSSGTMFNRDYPGAESIEEEAEMARQRIALEPVIEIMQHKGDSECRNGFANVIGAPDELCEFEKLFVPKMPECQPGAATQDNDVLCTAPGGFARTALAIGLAEKERIGANPFEFGFIAATDTHNANPGDVVESTWDGHVGNRDNTAAARMASQGQRTNAMNNPGGIAAVWAEENSREAIFDAIRRKETYGTSGPRISVRLFGGWNYPEDLCSRDDFVTTGYAAGVPMGGNLTAPPTSSRAAAAPMFALHAQADPGTEGLPGGLLQRAQIIKVWNDAEGLIHETVFDVAGDANNGADIDPATCQPRGPGANELCQVWSDPDFDATKDAVYYARVVENPSCRWQTAECIDLEGEDRPAVCEGFGHIQKVIQERAWTSPIWYQSPG